MHFQPIVEEQMVVLKLSLARPQYTSLPHTYLGTLLVLRIDMPVHGLILVLVESITDVPLQITSEIYAKL